MPLYGLERKSWAVGSSAAAQSRMEAELVVARERVEKEKKRREEISAGHRVAQQAQQGRIEQLESWLQEQGQVAQAKQAAWQGRLAEAQRQVQQQQQQQEQEQEQQAEIARLGRHNAGLVKALEGQGKKEARLQEKHERLQAELRRKEAKIEELKKGKATLEGKVQKVQKKKKGVLLAGELEEQVIRAAEQQHHGLLAAVAASGKQEAARIAERAEAQRRGQM